MSNGARKRKDDPNWKEFEAIVGKGLESIGYRVTRDELVSANQIDLVAIKEDKLLQHRFLVECKGWEKPVGIETVRGMAGIVHSSQVAAMATFGLIVALSGFTKDAKDFAVTSGVKLLTLQELTLQSFNPQMIVDQTIIRFEQDSLAKTYIDLTCSINEYRGGTVYKPVEKFLDEFLTTTKKPGVAVLGNFGSGKTSLCRHYAYLLASRWKAGRSDCLLPIYVNLRELADLCSLPKDLRGVLQTQYGVTSTEEELHNWLSHGKTLLLLDGFDEMAARLDASQVHHSLSSLNRFIELTSTKIILTCRTHFFRTRVEEDSLRTTVKLYVRDWGPEELASYVTRVHGDSATKTVEIIQNTYNLEELARTPIFLQMITSTITELGSNINRSKLYQLYTDQWMETQSNRARVSPQEVRVFMQELALRLFTTGQSTVEYKVLPDLIKSVLALRDRESVMNFDQDMRTCTFLVRDNDGRYAFVHRSFMEFFLGLRLAEEIKSKEYGTFNRMDLSVEVAGFLASFYESEPEALIRLLMSDIPAAGRGNCARALGTLVLTPRLEEALLVAFDCEESDVVRERLVEGLTSAKSLKVIERLLEHARRDTPFGRHCLLALGELSSTDAIPIYCSLMEIQSSAEQLRVALTSIAKHQLTACRPAVTAFLTSDRWRGYEKQLPLLLAVVEAIADVDMAPTCMPLLMVAAERGDQYTAMVRRTDDAISSRFRSAVETHAREGHGRGLTHPANLGALRQRFGRFLDDSHVNDVLGVLYGKAKISGRKVSGRKGG